MALLYAAIAKACLGLDAVSGFATLVWPPTGLALATLLLGGFRLWPGILLGACAANVWAGAPPAAALGVATGNALEAIAGAYALRRWCAVHASLTSLKQVLGLIVYAATLSTLLSATLGVASLSMGGVIRSSPQAAVTWRAWWVGDVLGDLVIGPLLLLPRQGAGDARGRGPRRIAEATVLAVLLVAASAAVFFRRSRPVYPFESPYILFPLFVWAALRFELRGAAIGTAIASAVAVYGTTTGAGPFARETLSSGLLALQTFLGCAAVTPLVVAGVTMDRSRAVRLQEAFTASVPHDLRNPLQSLRMSSEALLRRPTEEGVRRHHRVVLRSVDGMLRLIADLLDASALERGRLAVEPQGEDALALVQEAMELLRPLAVARRQTLHGPGLEPPEKIEISCDRGRILQVLSNVIGNAIKFSPEGTGITVEVVAVPKAVSFSVRDAGPGIAQADLRHVFERDWHTKASSGGGSGMGLFICKGIIEAHGGQIWAESKPGKGATFRFTLPSKSRAQ